MRECQEEIPSNVDTQFAVEKFVCAKMRWTEKENFPSSQIENENKVPEVRLIERRRQEDVPRKTVYVLCARGVR